MISIVTVTYNNYSELKDTINSLSFYNGNSIIDKSIIELIVVNGGECQQTLSFLQDLYLENKFDLKFKFKFKITVINGKDRGIADAFNKGISQADPNTDAITFLNSGDQLIKNDYYLWANQFLTSSTAKNSEIDFIHSDVLFEDTLCGQMRMGPTHKNLGRGMPYYHQTMIVRKRVFDDIGGFDSSYKIAMDYNFVCRMQKSGYNKGYYYCANEAVVMMDGKGVSAIRERESIVECFRSLKESGALNIKNLNGIIVRFSLYKFRMMMMMVGAEKLLRVLKKLKHRK
ncbi:MAG: glycosyltransferase [Oligoflexia bacterium]|nr:glycosyltransferase [Oligoflexia bacterium]